jgi:hypothetical protein
MSDHPFPAHWAQQGNFFHRVNGSDYGPSAVGESLEAYKARVKGAYGSLRGVTFHINDEERRHESI